nr:PHD finger protein ALFIN-LIKE 4-like isoform X2 [Tanacetum cinerariifolium]
MINDLPTVFEVVNGTAQTNQKEKSTVSNHSSTKSKSNSKPPPPPPGLLLLLPNLLLLFLLQLLVPLWNTPSTGENYTIYEFWICCDFCEKWFHGKCVKITPARAEKIKQYKCPYCSAKRARS